jgi:hypothetical protein
MVVNEVIKEEFTKDVLKVAEKKIKHYKAINTKMKSNI